ncbi:hypothetical protein BG452_04570 [Streptomyces sp. CBMA123]|nr:hypothetical protein [Streptomyces sp. CBMA123]
MGTVCGTVSGGCGATNFKNSDVNETITAFVLGGSAPEAAGGVGTVTDWATEVEFLLLAMYAGCAVVST